MKKTNKYVIREGWVSIIFNCLLFVIKYWAGIVSGSVALIADAWHTMTDTISSVIVLISGKVMNKPPDKEHPYGHGRAEHIANLIIGVLLAIVAFDFLVSAYTKFKSGEPSHFGIIAIIVTGISIISKEAMARYAFWTYKKSKLDILKSDGLHHRSDALSSIIIMAGIFLNKYAYWIDSLLATLVAILIAYASYEILNKEIDYSLGEKIDSELKKKIKASVTKLLGHSVYIHHFHLHQYGYYQELNCHIKLPGERTLNEVHNTCTKIEQMLSLKFNIVATIHPEPINDTDKKSDSIKK